MQLSSPEHRRIFITRLGTALILLLSQVFAVSPVHSQDMARLRITAPDTSQFPLVSFALEPFDAEGTFLAALQPGEVLIFEDARLPEQESTPPATVLPVETTPPLATLTPTVEAEGRAGQVPLPIIPQEVVKIEPGMQILLAFNPGLSMLYPTADSRTRFQVLRSALEAWADSRSSATPDQLYFIAGEEVRLSGSNQPAQWIQAMMDYAPDLLNATPSLASLTRALDLAVDPLPNPLSRRAILWITPILPPAAVQGLPSLADRAARSGVRIDVWLVASEPTPQNESILWQNLNELASVTGGRVFLYTGFNTLPDPETGFANLRHLYQVTYASEIRSGGSHTLQVQIRRDDLVMRSQQVAFDLNLLPPNPILISPPAGISRTWTEGTRQQPAVLQPDSLDLNILVEFADGRPRPLRATRLLVDGVVMDENLAAPFDVFTWDLASLESSGTSRIQVEAEDMLGLSQRSIETLVEVSVETRNLHWWDPLIQPEVLFTVAAVLVAMVGLAVVLLLARRRPRRRIAKNDPLTQPVPGIRKPIRPGKPAPERPSRRSRQGSTPPPARLQRLDDAGNPVPGEVIDLRRREITVGHDARHAMAVIDSPSVSSLHARIVHPRELEYILSDAGSVAGTWVNYSPVSRSGIKLEHGDLVYFGRVAYRFLLANPEPPAEPLVTPYQEME